MVIFAADAGSGASSAAQLATATAVESLGFESICLALLCFAMPFLAVCLSSCVSGWGSATARVVCLLDRRLDAMPGASGCARVFGDCDGDGDGESWRCVSASAVVALRAAKRLWRNTKAMRG